MIRTFGTSGAATKDEKRPLMPPHNHGAEQDLLGAAFRDKEVADYICRNLTKDHFQSTRHKNVFGAMQAIILNGNEIDVTTVAEELNATGLLSEVGVYELTQIATCLTAAAWRQKLAMVQEKFAQRQIQGAGLDLLSEASALTGPIGETLEGFIDRLREIQTRASGVSVTDVFDTMNGPAIAAAELSVEYLVDDVLVKGQSCVIGAPEKCCKTLISTELAISLVTGMNFLGSHRVNGKHNVWFPTGESGYSVIRDNMLAICRTKGVKLTDLEGLHLSDVVPDISQRPQLDKIRRTIEAHKINVLIIDPGYMMMGHDLEAGNLMIVGHILGGLSRVAQEMGVTVAVNHHFNKNIAMGDLPMLSHLTQAGWREHFRSWILLNRLSHFDPDEGQHEIVANIGGSAGHAGYYRIDIFEGRRKEPLRKVRFEVRKHEPKKKGDGKDSKADKLMQIRCGKVIEALNKYPDGATARKLRAETGITSNPIMADLLEVLTVQGLITDASVNTSRGVMPGHKLSGSKWVNPDSDPSQPTNGSTWVSGSLAYKGETQTHDPVDAWEPPTEGESF